MQPGSPQAKPFSASTPASPQHSPLFDREKGDAAKHVLLSKSQPFFRPASPRHLDAPARLRPLTLSNSREARREKDTEQQPHDRDEPGRHEPAAPIDRSPQQQHWRELQDRLAPLLTRVSDARTASLPWPMSQVRELANELWQLVSDAVYADRMHLAEQAMNAAQGLLDRYPADAELQTIVRLLCAQWEEAWTGRFQWPAAKALLRGDRPLIEQTGEGWAVSFRVNPSASLGPWKDKIVQLGREWVGANNILAAVRLFDAVASGLDDNKALRQDLLNEIKRWEPLVYQACKGCFQDRRAEEATLLLDAALSAVPQPRFCHRLLKALAKEFIPSATGPLSGQGRQGLSQAIRLLAGQQWWDPLSPYFLPPEARMALLAHGDWATRVEVLGGDISRRLGGQAASLNSCDVAQLLDDLDSLFHGASERHDSALLQRVQGWTQYLAERHVCAHAIASQAWLLDRCRCLIRACQQQRRALQPIRVNSQLMLQLSHDDQAGEWAVSEHPQPAGDPPQNTANDPSAFIADITRLLEDPEGPPWPLLNRLVAQACEAAHWEPGGMPWLRWCLLEAGRRTLAQPPTQPLEQHLRELEKACPSQESGGQGIARDALFGGLLEGIPTGLPWLGVQRAIDAAQRSGWPLTLSQRWSLCLALAERGEPQALSDLLQPGLRAGELDDAQLGDWLSLCERDRLSVKARTRLLRQAHALFPPESPLHQRYAALLPRHPVLPSRGTPRDNPMPRPPRAPGAATPSSGPVPPDVRVLRARQALRPWFGIDTSQPSQVSVQVSRHKAPRTPEEWQAVEALLSTWIATELQQGTLAWPDVRGIIDHLETAWAHTVDRQFLLALCLQHARRANLLGPLLDQLHRWSGAPPTRALLASLLETAAQRLPSDAQRAALIGRLIAWLPSDGGSDAALHIACVKALLALPAGEARERCVQRYLATLADGADKAMARLFANPPHPDGLPALVTDLLQPASH